DGSVARRGVWECEREGPRLHRAKGHAATDCLLFTTGEAHRRDRAYPPQDLYLLQRSGTHGIHATLRETEEQASLDRTHPAVHALPLEGHARGTDGAAGSGRPDSKGRCRATPHRRPFRPKDCDCFCPEALLLRSLGYCALAIGTQLRLIVLQALLRL